MKSKVRARPRRPLKNDIYSLISVLAIPFALALIFPLDAVSFEAVADPSHEPSSCAFIELSDDDMVSAINNARGAWRVSGNKEGRVSGYLSLSELPEERLHRLMNEDDRQRIINSSHRLFTADLLPPSKSANAPKKIMQENDNEEGLPFSRDELLKLF